MSAEVERFGTPDLSRPLAGLAVYTMYRGEPQQLLQWCNFHLNAGVSKLYVLLDCPDEALVSALPVDPRVHWEVMTQQAWDSFYPRGSQNVEAKQVGGFRWLARRAAAEGQGYLALVDADELISLYEPFTSIADGFPDAPAITLPVREMWYAETDVTTEPFAATLAVRKSSARRVNWSRAFGWRAQFLRNGLLGHDAGKSIYRLPIMANDITVHQPRKGPSATMTEELPATCGGILHFDCGSLGTWNAKWRARLNGGTVAAGLGPQRQAQQRLFSHELRQTPQNQAMFFRKFFSLDDEAQSLLQSHGLLEHVDDVGAMITGPLPLSSRPDDSTDTELVRLPSPAARTTFQFALVCDKRFVKPTFATMTSVLAHMGDKGSVRFVVLGDGLGAEDVLHLRSLERAAFDVQVLVHDITADLDRDVGTEDTKRATFGRIYLIDYLPEQRTVYLDGDVLATRDVGELFELNLGTACLAGVPDSAALRLVANPEGVPIQQRSRLIGITDNDPLEYLNGGVLILDLDNPDFRALALQSRSLVVMQGRALKQRDQDAMNIAFAGRKYRLESKFNYMTQFYTSDRCLDGDLVQRKYDAADASLIHFSGKIKPWETPQEEFYNGLYRRLVSDAEERVGVSCKFYFSRPGPQPRHDWTVDQWVEALESSPGRPALARPVADIAVVDLCDTGAYLRMSSAMYEFALAENLRLVASAQGRTLFTVPLDRLGHQEVHLSERLGPGVRRLSFNLPAALASCGGVARQLEMVLTHPTNDPHVGFVRSLGVFDILAAGSSATPDLLKEVRVDGGLETLEDGSLSGWYRPLVMRSGEVISLYIDGELAAVKSPSLHRSEPPNDDRVRGFKFNISHLFRARHAGEGELSVRITGANIPLHGSPLNVNDLDFRLRYDVGRDAWVESRGEPERRSLLERLRRRMMKE